MLIIFGEYCFELEEMLDELWCEYWAIWMQQKKRKNQLVNKRRMEETKYEKRQGILNIDKFCTFAQSMNIEATFLSHQFAFIKCTSISTCILKIQRKISNWRVALVCYVLCFFLAHNITWVHLQHYKSIQNSCWWMSHILNGIYIKAEHTEC